MTDRTLFPSESPLLEMRSITKRFGGIVANQDVSVSFYPGEVHSLLGENGAGKSTLIKILAGLYKPDAGTVCIDGRERSITSPAESRAHGIGVVHQRLELVPALTLVENIALQEGGSGRFDRRRWKRLAREVAEGLGFRIFPDLPVGRLSTGDAQRAEIVRSLLSGGRVIILDEPTSLLSPPECDALYSTLDRLAASGRAVVFVSHRLQESIDHSQRVTVLRQGQVVGRIAPGEQTSVDLLVKLIVGEEKATDEARSVIAETELGPVKPSAVDPSQRLLELRSVSARSDKGGRLVDVSLHIDKGEILGVAGVDGNGQEELCAVCVGALKPDAGSVTLRGVPLANIPPSARTRRIADIPETGELAIVDTWPLWKNLGLRALSWEAPQRMRRKEALIEEAERLALQFDIRASSMEVAIATLSGGNQQRAVLSRELVTDTEVVIALHPTKGLDITSSLQIRCWIEELAASGAAVLYVSADLHELLAISHRLAVLYSGSVVGTFSADEVNLKDVGKMMVGSTLAQGY